MRASLSNEQVEKTFQNHDIRTTAVRLMIWKKINTLDFAFALCDLEGIMPTVDRSTIFRALILFVDKGLLHTIDDGSGQQKYCICHELEHSENKEGCHNESNQHKHEDCQHVHLSCIKCGRTFCLRSQKIPPVQIPEGFQIIHMQYIIQGICPHCAHIKQLETGHECCHNIE